MPGPESEFGRPARFTEIASGFERIRTGVNRYPARVADAIHCSEITKTYGTKVAIQSLDLQVERGSIFGFLGPNGAGKTTMIRILLGLLRSDSGSARVLGNDAWSESTAIRKHLGYVPGDLRLWGWMSGETALETLSAVHDRELHEHGFDLAERLRLDMSIPVHSMSRGTRQKLGLVMALASRPELLLLDEPTTALDPITQADLFDILREHVARGGTVFFSSHVLAEVEALCSHVAFVREGKIVVDASLEALRQESARHVRIVFGKDAPNDLTHTLGELGLRWRSIASPGQPARERRGAFHGPVEPLVRWLASQEIADIELGAPDLESMFLSHYRRPTSIEDVR